MEFLTSGIKATDPPRNHSLPPIVSNMSYATWGLEFESNTYYGQNSYRQVFDEMALTHLHQIPPPRNELPTYSPYPYIPSFGLPPPTPLPPPPPPLPPPPYAYPPPSEPSSHFFHNLNTNQFPVLQPMQQPPTEMPYTHTPFPYSPQFLPTDTTNNPPYHGINFELSIQPPPTKMPCTHTSFPYSPQFLPTDTTNNPPYHDINFELSPPQPDMYDCSSQQLSSSQIHDEHLKEQQRILQQHLEEQKHINEERWKRCDVQMHTINQLIQQVSMGSKGGGDTFPRDELLHEFNQCNPTLEPHQTPAQPPPNTIFIPTTTIHKLNPPLQAPFIPNIAQHSGPNSIICEEFDEMTRRHNPVAYSADKKIPVTEFRVFGHLTHQLLDDGSIEDMVNDEKEKSMITYNRRSKSCMESLIESGSSSSFETDNKVSNEMVVEDNLKNAKVFEIVLKAHPRNFDQESGKLHIISSFTKVKELDEEESEGAAEEHHKPGFSYVIDADGWLNIRRIVDGSEGVPPYKETSVGMLTVNYWYSSCFNMLFKRKRCKIKVREGVIHLALVSNSEQQLLSKKLLLKAGVFDMTRGIFTRPMSVAYVKLGIVSDGLFANSLVGMYETWDSFDESMLFFNKVGEREVVVMWNSMGLGYSENGRFLKIQVELFRSNLCGSIIAEMFPYYTLHSFSNINDVSEIDLKMLRPHMFSRHGDVFFDHARGSPLRILVTRIPFSFREFGIWFILANFTMGFAHTASKLFLQGDDFKLWMQWLYYISPMSRKNVIALMEFLDKCEVISNNNTLFIWARIGEVLFEKRRLSASNSTSGAPIIVLLRSSLIFNGGSVLTTTYLNSIMHAKSIILSKGEINNPKRSGGFSLSELLACSRSYIHLGSHHLVGDTPVLPNRINSQMYMKRDPSVSYYIVDSGPHPKLNGARQETFQMTPQHWTSVQLSIECESFCAELEKVVKSSRRYEIAT